MLSFLVVISVCGRWRDVISRSVLRICGGYFLHLKWLMSFRLYCSRRAGEVVFRISLFISPIAIPFCTERGMCEEPNGYENELVGL